MRKVQGKTLCSQAEYLYKSLIARRKVFVDMTVPYPASLIGNWYWIGVVDDFSRYYWSFFKNTKLQLPNKMEDLVKKMTSRGTPVKHLRCYNEGEHQ